VAHCRYNTELLTLWVEPPADAAVARCLGTFLTSGRTSPRSFFGGVVGCASLDDGANSSDSSTALPSIAPRRPGGVRHSLPAYGRNRTRKASYGIVC
jgi:hypothetical protein